MLRRDGWVDRCSNVTAVVGDVAPSFYGETFATAVMSIVSYVALYNGLTFAVPPYSTGRDKTQKAKSEIPTEF